MKDTGLVIYTSERDYSYIVMFYKGGILPKYYLHKDGKLHKHIQRNEVGEWTSFWNSRKEAEQFLKEWPERHPAKYAAYVTEILA